MFANEADLDDALSEPTPHLIEAMSRIPGDVTVLGAGGKMGLTLVRMLQQASQRAGIARRIVAVSRFTRPGHRELFEQHGLSTVAGDLLDDEFLAQLPGADNVIFMTGMKFGATDDAPRTWAMNVDVPAQVCRHFAESRVLAFSTGNVYPLVPVNSAGCTETDATGPVGEYAMTALGRERMFQYFAQRERIPTSIVRLNYAVEMRYGVVVDLATKVARGEPIDLSMGYVNVIWQADANAWALSALADASVPAHIINVAGPEILEVRRICEQLADRMGRPVAFRGEPAPTALLNDASQAAERYGPVRVTASQLIDWIADWVRADKPTWSKPTHFQTRDGKF